jgi:hypothetical protein
MKLKLAWQVFVIKTPHTDFHENQTVQSRTDWRDLHLRRCYFFIRPKNRRGLPANPVHQSLPVAVPKNGTCLKNWRFVNLCIRFLFQDANNILQRHQLGKNQGQEI